MVLDFIIILDVELSEFCRIVIFLLKKLMNLLVRLLWDVYFEGYFVGMFLFRSLFIVLKRVWGLLLFFCIMLE